MPGTDGLQLLDSVLQATEPRSFTGHGDVPMAVQALRLRV
jgi:FixJ family two-component response regulator